MMKKFLTAFAALLCSLGLFAQTSGVGGVKGTVVNRAGRVPVPNAHITIVKDAQAVFDDYSRADGSFIFEGLEDGRYIMTVSAAGFLTSRINLTVEGYVKDLIFVSLVAEQSAADIDDSNFAEFDMEDSGYTDAPTLLPYFSGPMTRTTRLSATGSVTCASRTGDMRMRRRMFSLPA